MRYVIIGNSAAGINGAEAIRMRDNNGEITIISEEDYPAYSRCLIPYFMEGKLAEEDMLYRPAGYYEENRFNTILGRRAVSIDTKEKCVKLDNNECISYDKLLIATGGSPKLPDIPGIEKDGVFGFRTTKDLKGILRIAKTAKEAVVTGGGCIGLMAACGLHSLGLKVSIVIRSRHLLSQVADPEAGEIFRKRFETNGIPVLTETDVVKITGDKTISGVELDNGKKISCQLLIAGKGVTPNIELVKNTDIAVHDGIIVDDEQRTTATDVYAAGDVAETIDIVTGKRTVNAIWPAAAEQGRIAGANMTGEHKKYAGSIRMNSADFFGLPLISIGMVKPPPGQGYEFLTYYNEKENIFKKVVILNNILVGAVLVGDIENAGVYRSLIEKKIDISPIKKRLLDKRFGFTSVLELIDTQKQKFYEPEYRDALLCLSD
jgi:NAD(P)H-nitrite reductase large subunit